MHDLTFAPDRWERDGHSYVAEGRLVLSEDNPVSGDVVVIARFDVGTFVDWMHRLNDPDHSPSDLNLSVSADQILAVG